jgi:hypothetical protein
MEQQNQEQQIQVQWRRDKVQELCSKATVNRDISYLRDQAKDNIKRYEKLSKAYKKSLLFWLTMKIWVYAVASFLSCLSSST